MHQKDVSIVYIRVLAMCMIVVCHLMEQVQHPLAHIGAMFFNVGVELFFMISAYLYGQRKIHSGIIHWYQKRFYRVAIPCYVFLVLLFCIYIFEGLDIDVFHWCAQFLLLQGWEIYVFGAEHLWFITILAFCYLITPLLQWIEHIFLFRTRICFFAANILLQIFATFYISTQLGRYWFLVNFYILCYELGAQKFRCCTKKQFAVISLLGICGIATRLVGKIYFDDTILYNIFISGITHCMLAISIFGVVQFLASDKAGKLISFLDSISYEVYLVHYMLIVGPISLLHLTKSFCVDSVITIAASLMIAAIVHYIAHMKLMKISG